MRLNNFDYTFVAVYNPMQNAQDFQQNHKKNYTNS